MGWPCGCGGGCSYPAEPPSSGWDSGVAGQQSLDEADDEAEEEEEAGSTDLLSSSSSNSCSSSWRAVAEASTDQNLLTSPLRKLLCRCCSAESGASSHTSMPVLDSHGWLSRSLRREAGSW